MKLDMVHDIQTLYRKVVDSMSRPGVISDLSAECLTLGGEEGCSPASLLLALILLDTEVTFKVVSAQESLVTNRFYQLTYAKMAEVEQADYIFVSRDASKEDLHSVIQRAKIGELNEPHQSALIIVELDSVTSGNTIRLSGPGIKAERLVHISMDMDWVTIREQRNSDYPLGIDLVFVDANHRILCLPRTSRVMQQEV